MTDKQPSSTSATQPQWVPTEGRSRWRSVLWIWPVGSAFTASLLPLVALLGSSTATTHPVTFAELLARIGGWTRLAYADALNVTGIIATVLIATAATVGLSGDWSGVHSRARTVVNSILAVSLAVLLGISAFAVPTIAAYPEETFHVLFVFLTGWVTALVGFGVFEITPLSRQRAMADDEWTRRSERAARSRIYRTTTTPARRRLNSNLVFWIAPLLAWAFMSTALLAWGLPTRGPTIAETVIVTCMYYGDALACLFWRGTSDVSRTRRTRLLVRGSGSIIGLSISAIFGALVWIHEPTRWLGVGILGFSLLHIGSLNIPKLDERLPWRRTIVINSTASALRSTYRVRETTRSREAELSDAAAPAKSQGVGAGEASRGRAGLSRLLFLVSAAPHRGIHDRPSS